MWMGRDRDRQRYGERERGESWTGEAYGCRAGGCMQWSKVAGCDLKQTPA